MSQIYQIIQSKSKGVLTLLVLLIIGAGCSEKKPDETAESSPKQREVKEGLVQVAETPYSQITVKYLTPEYLTKVERVNQGVNTALSVDSLKKAYSKTMSFQIQVQSEDAPAKQIAVNDEQHGLLAIEKDKERFRLESIDTVWYPLLAQPESHVQSQGQTWFVVFPVEPDKDLREDETLSIVYVSSDPDQEVIRLSYNTNEFID